MCGLITSISFNKEKFNNSQRILKQYLNQRTRGLEGFGFIAKKGDELILYRSKKEESIKERLEKLGDTDFILFHHRKPTSSPNAVKSNQPIVINHNSLEYKYFFIHNGSILNHDDLQKEYEKTGYKYSSKVKTYYTTKENATSETNDSESLGIALAMFIEGKETLIKAEGIVACFLLQVDTNNNPLNLFFFRDGKPIVFYRNQAGMFFSSEGKGEDLHDKRLYCYNLSSNVLKFDILTQTYKEEMGFKTSSDSEENLVAEMLNREDNEDEKKLSKQIEDLVGERVSEETTLELYKDGTQDSVAVSEQIEKRIDEIDKQLDTLEAEYLTKGYA